jgi:hypothetical protein
MNKKSLTHLPFIVKDMDENLTINISDFINNQLIKDLNLHQAKLIEVIKSSNKFHYDIKTGMIKFKEKADRNILIIGDFIRSSEQDEKKSKEEYLKEIIREMNKNYFHKIKKLDNVGKGFHIVFEHEDISIEVEKYLLGVYLLKRMSSENVNLLSFKYYDDLKNSNICLAAESLKRRIINNTLPLFNSLWAQANYLNAILLNPVPYIPRRFTAIEIDHLHNLKRLSNLGNNIPDIDVIVNGNENVKTQNKYFIHSNTYVNNSSKKSKKQRKSETNYLTLNNNNFVKKEDSIRKLSTITHNKFDLVNGYGINSSLKEMTSQAITYNSLGNPSTNSANYNKFVSSVNENQMRRVSYNISRDPNIETPLNKVYDLKINRDESNLKVNSIKFKYEKKEILSVYFHMNFLKKFEFPEELKNNFISSVMMENPKSLLESLKVKNLESTVKIKRMRSKSIFVPAVKRCNILSLNLFSFIRK